MAFALVDTQLLARVAEALERIANRIDGVVEMRDVDRAKVYSEHLGKKLSEGDK